MFRSWRISFAMLAVGGQEVSTSTRRRRWAADGLGDRNDERAGGHRELVSSRDHRSADGEVGVPKAQHEPTVATMPHTTADTQSIASHPRAATPVPSFRSG